MFHLANLELTSYGRPIGALAPNEVTRHFNTSAPTELETPPISAAAPQNKLSFRRRIIDGGATILEKPGAANVQLYELFPDIEGPELVICDMLSGWVSWIDPDDPEDSLHPIARLKNPCHSELVDLDQDGRLDLLIAELGAPEPSDVKNGSVALLRQTADREFEVVRITDAMGRVADARPADFDGDGDLDVIVAEFGWRKLGSLVYLENRSEGDTLRFEPRVVDPRHGAIHVPILDLNGDDKPDFVALISQEHESVVAFLNQGDAQFETAEIFTGPHPHWGSSGIQPIDFDGDGDIDFLATNGDSLDDSRLRSYHGIYWLENKGQYPYTLHAIAKYYGVHRAEGGDIDGDGDLDIAISSFLPGLTEDALEKLNLNGLSWLEQTSQGVFERHTVAVLPTEYPTLDLGDLDGDGKLDLIIGNLMGFLREDGSDPGLIEIFQQTTP